MIRVQQGPFDPGTEINAFLAANANSGAIATFIGQVRNFLTHNEPSSQKITALELEHYPGMTQKELERIAEDAGQRWPLDDILIIHRFGEMQPGHAIVLVCTAATHRGDAFEACEFLMDWLKTKAPFWKREETESGSSWVDARASDDDRAARWEKTT